MRNSHESRAYGKTILLIDVDEAQLVLSEVVSDPNKVKVVGDEDQSPSHM